MTNLYIIYLLMTGETSWPWSLALFQRAYTRYVSPI